MEAGSWGPDNPNTELNKTFRLISWEGKMYDIETLLIDRGLHGVHFYKKIMQKIRTKSFLTQSLLMTKIMKNKKGLVIVTSCSSGYKTSSKKLLY